MIENRVSKLDLDIQPSDHIRMRGPMHRKSYEKKYKT